VVGFVGSMKPWHGLLDLLEAFARVARRAPAPLLVLVGSGPEEQAVRRRASAADLRGKVVMIGAVPHAEVPGLLQAIDIAVATYTGDDSYFSPLKVLEYMAAGRPVVYPAIGDLQSLIGQTGLSYPAADVTALASRLEQLIADAALRRRLGAAASGRARDLDWTRVADRLIEIAPRARVGQMRPR
jgi:glycosyltransferase involved in cell wall biosynthesis